MTTKTNALNLDAGTSLAGGAATETNTRDLGTSTSLVGGMTSLETQTEADLLAAGSQDVADPCAGKTGALLSACRLGQTGKQWEVRNGIFFSESRADKAPNDGSKFIIKGDGIKYKYGW